ncbi:hypothetical protein BC938DRAFT_477677 [Jimgerdemannia flammicorona]|uniref:Uncharacterized protein n=1 Tax=Jimgerdemannia flammicorona TaxID=994334 RepID=A0A433QNZ9_9FUNG|nr:hypothetical protein BC938DRAFT_477677 [Jimgerdemannia flammicorona]
MFVLHIYSRHLPSLFSSAAEEHRTVAPLRLAGTLAHRCRQEQCDHSRGQQTAAVRARAHGNDPAGLWHLVVNLAERWGHLVCEGAGDDHDVGLAWGGAEDDAKTILVVARGGDVHHLDSAASEA